MLDLWFTGKGKTNPKGTQFYNLAQTLISLNNSHPLSTGTLMYQRVSWFLVRLASRCPVINGAGEQMYGAPNQRPGNAHQNAHRLLNKALWTGSFHFRICNCTFYPS